jgi:hypothetical protein
VNWNGRTGWGIDGVHYAPGFTLVLVKALILFFEVFDSLIVLSIMR